jgi:hypothetical protein
MEVDVGDDFLALAGRVEKDSFVGKEKEGKGGRI